MNYTQLHKAIRKLDTILYDKFEKQLTDIDSAAIICYHSHYDKLTISLFPRNTTSSLNWVEIETEHLIVLSNYQRTPEIEQLAHDLTKFIINDFEE